MTAQGEKQLIRNVIVIVLAGIIIQILIYAFKVPERLSGLNNKVEKLEVQKMDKDQAMKFFNDMMLKLGEQNATWNTYMLSNEKDKDQIMRSIERNQDQILTLLKEYKPVRGSTTYYEDMIKESMSKK